MTLFLTYTVISGGGSQLDRLPDTYRNIAIFDDELAALRHANKCGCKCINISPGQTIEQAIRDANHTNVWDRS